MKNLLLLFFGLLMTSPAWADIVVQGEVSRKFKVVNADEFEDFEFYIKYQEFEYNMGYQKADLREIVLKTGETYASGDRGARSMLFARKKGETEEFSSGELLGGNEIIDDQEVSYILDYVEIQSVEAGKVNFKVVKSEFIYPDGKKRKIRKGLIGIGGPWFLIVAVIAFGAITVFFFLRRKGEHEV